VETVDELRKKPDNRCLAVISINLFAVSTTLTAVMFLYGQKYKLQVLEFVCIRNIVFLLFTIPLLVISKKMPCRDEPVGSVKFMATRAFFGISYLVAVLTAVIFIPLSLSVVVVYLQPFWTSILAYFINGEPISAVEIIAMLVCFAAVVGLTLSATEEKGEETKFSMDMIYGVAISFLAGWFFAFASIMNRRLKGVNPGFVILWPAGLGSIGVLLVFLIRFASFGTKFFVYENNLAFVFAVVGGITDIGAVVFHLMAF